MQNKWVMLAAVGLVAYMLGKRKGAAATAGSGGETRADVPAEWWTYAGGWQ